MAREHAQVNMGIWQDNDFRALPPPAQHLYFTLWTHPGLSYCGVLDWRPGRIAALSAGWTGDDVVLAGQCLQARHFIVVDEGTEECLIRSWVRWDGLMKQPRIAVSYANAYAVVASNLLREAIIYELQQMWERDPDLAGFAKPQVVAMLDLPSVSAKVSVSVSDPFGAGVTHRFTPGFGARFGPSLGEPLPNVSGKVSVPPTPAPAPYSSSITPAVARSVTRPTSNEQRADDEQPGTIEQTLSEFATWCDQHDKPRPTSGTNHQLGKRIHRLLAEDVSIHDIRRALIAWWTKGGLSAAAFPSFVDEIRNPADGKSRRQAETDDMFDAAMERARENEAQKEITQ